MIRSRRAHQDSKSGQSTVEFALTLILLMGFVLFFLQSSLVLGWSNYVHYATFMSARAYLASGPTVSEQEERARAVAKAMLKKNGRDRFPGLSQGLDGSDDEVKGLFIQPPEAFVANPQNADFSWMEGVRYRFKSRLFMMPFAGSRGGKDPSNQLQLQSESWLGRDPSVQECQAYMNRVGGLIDNGC